jgi:rubrerythrin
MADREDPGYYAIIPADVRYNKSLSPNAKLLYGEITALCKKEGYCWASNRYFAELYSVQRSSISNWVKSLIDEGYITVELVYAEGKPNIDKRKIFLTHQIPVPQKQPGDTAAMKGGGQKNDQGGGQNNDQGGQKTRKRILQLINTNSKAAAADQSFSEIEKPPPETAAAENSAQEIQKLKAHFSSLNPLLLFDEWFYPKILEHLSKNKLGFNFVSWMYKFCLRQEPIKITGYFFKVFLQPRFIELYRAEGPPPAPARPPQSVSCPVCGAAHLASDEFCPQCKFLSSSAGKQEEVHYWKTLFLMPPEMKEQYYAECDQILKDNKNFKEMETRRLNLDKKYGLILDPA